jgi:hypothetical protein
MHIPPQHQVLDSAMNATLAAKNNFAAIQQTWSNETVTQNVVFRLGMAQSTG